MDDKRWYNAGFDECRTTLKKWREDNERRSEECVEMWEHVLSRKPFALGDEVWIVYEQVFLSAIDSGRLDVAQECIEALHIKFPKSQRVQKLEGMCQEALGRYDGALHIYQNLISKDPSNALYRKRKIAVLKAQGKTIEAIKDLRDYLEKFMNDNEGWLELSHFYMNELEYAKAAYCLEELILSNPHNHFFHQRLAEIKYTQGGLDNMEIAKSYFCQAAHLNGSNLRALFGILTCCYHLVMVGKVSGAKKKDLITLFKWAAEQISDKYHSESDNNSILVLQQKSVDVMLKNLLNGVGSV